MKDIEELDRLHAAATAGEWYRDERGFAPGVAVTLAFDGSPTLDGRTILRGNTAWPGECRANEDFAMHAKNAWPEVSARLRAAEAESAKLRSHYDAAAPEHNLLALLDLYEGRRLEAVAECERLRGALRNVRDDYDCDGVGVGGLECRHCLARAALGEP